MGHDRDETLMTDFHGCITVANEAIAKLPKNSALNNTEGHKNSLQM